ncbi:MAG: hypothetical protein V7642_6898 [Burkholderiales bacterium]
MHVPQPFTDLVQQLGGGQNCFACSSFASTLCIYTDWNGHLQAPGSISIWDVDVKRQGAMLNWGFAIADKSGPLQPQR